jgi:hypothetical protein
LSDTGLLTFLYVTKIILNTRCAALVILNCTNCVVDLLSLQAFVTCTIGVHMVGIIMLSVSLSSAVSAYVTGYIQKYVGRKALNLSGEA